MSIHYRIDHEARRVRVELDGIVTPAAYGDHLERLAAEGGLRYGRLVDARRADLVVRTSDVTHFVHQLTRLRQIHGRARTAFVVSGDALYGMARMYQMRNEDADPGFGVFRSMDEAEAWAAGESPSAAYQLH